MPVVLHLTSSTFFGGPERQMLGLARSLTAEFHSVFLSFSENRQCQIFLDEVRRQAFDAVELAHDTPHLLAAVLELTRHIREFQADVLCCHGFKADILGLFAARRAGIPVIAVSRGWTGENSKVRLYEMLDRLFLRGMDRVVGVSKAQAAKVRAAGVAAGKILVIPNAIRTGRFDHPDPSARAELERLFPDPVRRIAGAAGRLSPEKGFDTLIEAATHVLKADAGSGFVLFGEGVLRERLAAQIVAHGLEGRFVLAGFRSDLDRFIPHLDLLVQSSYTEGMPNVVLEACAAGVPVVATAVGGTPEVVDDGESGYLVPSGDTETLARRMSELLSCGAARRAMGRHGQARIRERFTFEAQAFQYHQLFEELVGCRTDPNTGGPIVAPDRGLPAGAFRNR